MILERLHSYQVGLAMRNATKQSMKPYRPIYRVRAGHLVFTIAAIISSMLQRAHGR